jgi:tripartite-type tricarboxylate transporter receptor subunit TctC
MSGLSLQHWVRRLPGVLGVLGVSGVLGALLLNMGATHVMAQDYPSKPIRMWIPSSAGGATDVAARILGVHMAEILAQPVIVENRVTSGGMVATSQLAQSAPDGYTLMMTFDTFATTPHMYKSAPYDVVKDFTPIMLVTRYPQILIVHPSLKVKTLREFVAYAKANGARMNFGSAGPGSSARLSYELFKDVAGIETMPVHYKGGGPAVQDLIAGQLHVMLIQASGTIQQSIKAGKLVGLATSGLKRSPQFPDLPVIADFYPGFETISWVGLIGPAGIPRPIVDRLNATLGKILGTADMKEKMAGQGAEIVASTPDEFGATIRNENTRWGRIIRDKKISID